MKSKTETLDIIRQLTEIFQSYHDMLDEREEKLKALAAQKDWDLQFAEGSVHNS